MKATEIKLKILRGEFTPERALNEIEATYIEIEEKISDFLEGVSAGVVDFPDDLCSALPLSIEEYFQKNDQHDTDAFRAFWWSLKETGWDPPDLEALRWLKIDISRKQAEESQFFISIRTRMVRGEITEEQAIREARAAREKINWEIMKRAENPKELLTTMQIFEEQIQLGEILRNAKNDKATQGRISEILNARKLAEGILLEQGYDFNDVMYLEQMIHNYEQANKEEATKPKELANQSGKKGQETAQLTLGLNKGHLKDNGDGTFTVLKSLPKYFYELKKAGLYMKTSMFHNVLIKDDGEPYTEQTIRREIQNTPR